MEDSIKDLFSDLENTQYTVYVGQCVLFLKLNKGDDLYPELLFKTYGIRPEDKDPRVEDWDSEFQLHLHWVAESKEQIYEFDKIIREKVRKEFGDNSDGKNKIVVTSYDPALEYSIAAHFFDFLSQDILQESFSLKQLFLKLEPKEVFHHKWYDYDSDVMQKIDSIGSYIHKDQFKDNILNDYVKAYQSGYIKESTITETNNDTIDLDDYKIYVTEVKVGPTQQIWGYGTKYVFFSPTKEQAAKNLLKIYANVKKHNEKKDQKHQCKVYGSNDRNVIYSIAAKDYNYENQLLLQDIFDICKAAYNGDHEVEIPALDPYAPLRKYNFYTSQEEFANNYFSDLVEYQKDHPELEECCCAGGMGGVTTASFAPAITHTVYPRPGSKKKKKKSKKEDNETIEDIYSYYGCVVRLSLSFPGSDTKVRKYYVVLGKDLDQIDEFNQKINQNLKQISNNSGILSTTLTSMLYSAEIKDFDFEGQKLLDSSLYVDDPKKFISSEKQLDQEAVQIRDIMGRSYDNLADFTNELFVSMTEDSDDVYWPVRNDETDAFEKSITDARQAKKDKIIARKTKTIEKRNQTVKDWLARVGDTMDLVKMSNMFNKYNKVTNKMIVELERIKKLPLSSPEFL